jgi:TolA-binding protein
LKPTIGIAALLLTGGLMLLCSCGPGKKTEQELYSLAQQYSEKGDFQSAIRTYQDILKDYPRSPRACKAQFLIGFVYSENVKDYDHARIAYQLVIDNYPDCDLVDDARYMLENLQQEATPTIPDAGDSREDEQ